MLLCAVLFVFACLRNQGAGRQEHWVRLACCWLSPALLVLAGVLWVQARADAEIIVERTRNFSLEIDYDFAAGVADTIETVQAEESVAASNEDYISSLYSYNLAKVTLARAMGVAEESMKQLFPEK